MKSNFKDPIAVKEGKKIKSPWNFDAPPYDQRSSCFLNAGTDYGVGFNQPVGRKGNPKTNVDILPMVREKTMETSYVHKGKVSNVELNEKN